MSQKPRIDWEKVERDFRAGVMSLREIGEANGCSHVSVTQRAKAEGWTRDLNAKIRAKADALLNKATANSLPNSSADSVKQGREADTIEGTAAAIVAVKLGHRSDIGRGRSLLNKLMKEVEDQTDSVDLIEQLGQLAGASGDASDAALRIFNRVTSTSGRIDNAKKLAEAMKVLIGLERESYAMDSLPTAPVQPPAAFDYSTLPPDTLRQLREAAAYAAAQNS